MRDVISTIYKFAVVTFVVAIAFAPAKLKQKKTAPEDAVFPDVAMRLSHKY